MDSATDSDGGAVETGVAPSGGGFRAVARRDGEIVWSCPHVHFTEHSAKNCPALRSVRLG
ncbi:MAG TPA: hypothetical protein VNM91_02125 [Dehalococcoidia bacterium]|nr:hypothetical protein [Dehalococcoidia bacterium]